ncbi:protein unc-13 homolog C-like [Haliotis rufescens]|uniref:protein unc-13 homolog C-like n=1 Tax=Haliotis rufescens TaxID=6454 RepID=UPI00201F429E|nr:protein unc-13 homolog C-like [Haliotis rufescens]
MGICIEVWRVRIGTFTHPRGTRQVGHIGDYNPRTEWTPFTKMCYRLMATCLVLYTMTMVSAAIIHQHTRLLLSVDVELNPGPPKVDFQTCKDEILQELRAMKCELSRDSRDIKSDTRKLNQSVDELKLQIADMKSQQEILRLDIDALSERVACVEEHSSTLDRSAYSYVTDKIDNLENTVDKLEQYSRKQNILLYGVAEKPDENKMNIKEVICETLNTHNEGTPFSATDIVNAHRIGYAKSNRPRPIIVRFNSMDCKVGAIGLRDKLKESGYGIGSDLTTHQRKVLQDLRRNNKQGYYKNGALVVKDYQQHSDRQDTDTNDK